MAGFVLTTHCKKQMKQKGFTTARVMSALHNPKAITRVSQHPGQLRYIGNGLAIIVAPRDKKVVLTVYLDGVITPMRKDQKNDPAALASRRLNRGS